MFRRTKENYGVSVDPTGRWSVLFNDAIGEGTVADYGTESSVELGVAAAERCIAFHKGHNAHDQALADAEAELNRAADAASDALLTTLDAANDAYEKASEALGVSYTVKA